VRSWLKTGITANRSLARPAGKKSSGTAPEQPLASSLWRLACLLLLSAQSC
jgi:hypothetical protein